MTARHTFDSAYFDDALGTTDEKPPEFQSYAPLRLDLPKSTSFPIMMLGPKGGMKFNPHGVLEFLRSQYIVFDEGLPRQFDGRIYIEIPLQTVKDYIYDAVALAEGMYVPTDNDIRTILNAARSNLRVRFIGFPELEMGEDYETEPYKGLIAFENGIYNMSTGRLLPFTPFLYLTSYIHAEYDPRVTDADARSTLSGIIPNSETLDFLYEMCGYLFFNPTLYPPALFNLYGPGNTGKSAIAHMIEKVVGKENISKLGLAQLTARFTTSELQGKKLNICGETGDTSSKVTHIDGQLIKSLTDGDEITAERKHVDSFKMVNTAKFLFVTNSIPDFGDNSSGLYRRLYVIPCRIQQDKTASIYDKLTDYASKSWIINMALAGYRNFLDRGKVFSVSPQMEQELAQFKTQDSVMDFIQATFNTTDPTIVAKGIAESEEYCWTTSLYEFYVGYTREALSQPLSRKKFVERIRNEYALRTKTVAYNVSGLNTTRTKYYL